MSVIRGGQTKSGGERVTRGGARYISFFCLLSTTFEMAIAAFFYYEPPAAIFSTGSVLGQQVELSMNAYVNIKKYNR